MAGQPEQKIFFIRYSGRNQICASVMFYRNPAICSAELDGEICLFHPESAQYINLNATGSAIWTLLDAPQGRDWLVSQLLVRFDVGEAACGEETDGFLSEALKWGVLLEATA
jgi:hypothetical protein